jgi:hypothetical protein
MQELCNSINQPTTQIEKFQNTICSKNVPSIPMVTYRVLGLWYAMNKFGYRLLDLDHNISVILYIKLESNKLFRKPYLFYLQVWHLN